MLLEAKLMSERKQHMNGCGGGGSRTRVNVKVVQVAQEWMWR